LKLIFKVIIIASAAVVLMLGFYVVFKGISDKSLDKNTNIVVVFKTVDKDADFWKVVRAGVESAARDYGVNIEITGPNHESDTDDQIKIFEEIIERKPSAIIMAACDYNKLVPVAEKIKKAGIKLITLDSGINSSIPVSFIATDSREAGKKAGQTLAKLVEKNTKVVIISYVKGTSTAIEREEGVREGLLTKLSPHNIGDTYFCNGSEQRSYEIIKDLLTRRKDIGGIAGLNEQSSMGAAKAIAELGLAGKVKLVGFDSSINEIKLIEEGVIQATVVQKPFNMGYLSLETAVKLLKRNKIEKNIDTGSKLITKENMYTPESQKLLFPFVEEKYGS
jgi:ribose transport system substrate-binding protein